MGAGDRLWKRVVLVSALLGMAATAEVSANEAFSDLKGSYAQTEILRLVEAGIVSGYEDGTFRPEQAVTRAALAKILVLSLQLAEEPEAASEFEDVPEDAWYRGYAGALVKAGITQGASATAFSPNDPVTREQMAVFFIRAFGLEDKANKTALEMPFADIDQVSDWARPYVALAYHMGFIQGISHADGTLSFAPGEHAQRQALARLAYQFKYNRDPYLVIANRIVNERSGGADPGQAPGSVRGGEGKPANPGTNPAPGTGGSPASPGSRSGGGGGGGAVPAPISAVQQAIRAAIDAIDALPSADQLTLSHKQAVTEAREKVEAAKGQGAVDMDITNLNVLLAAEAKMTELESAPQPGSGPWIQSAQANVGGHSIAAEIGEGNVISFTIPDSVADSDRFTGLSIQASPDVQSISVTALGMTKSIAFDNGTANIEVSQILRSADPQGDGVAIHTLRAVSGGTTISLPARVTLQSGGTKQLTLVFNP